MAMWLRAAAAFTNDAPLTLHHRPRAQLLDEHPPQLLELHELELHELDELQLDDEQLLPEESEPPVRAAIAARANGGGSINALACAAHAVPASAPAPNSAAVHSNSSGVLRASCRSFRCASSVAR
ncbi:hypothetical protein, partial [Burkholderia cepacia]|uniref:hypothetical protein n=1 Tax=Burkholderia cepacia TaxID=292 RepID=UPI0015EC82B5